MSTKHGVEECIERAATTVGSVWPLHSFVTANPLAGFEDRPFADAVREGRRLFGGKGYPTAEVFRNAWEDGRIDSEILTETLVEYGYEDAPERLLDSMERTEAETAYSEATDQLDELVTKWLAAFLEEGRAEWPLPDREQGFYAAFRSVGRYDSEIPDSQRLGELPESPVETIEQLLSPYPTDEWQEMFTYHLAALPGWTGFIKQRAQDQSDWQSEYPITLTGYLAVRLFLADALSVSLEPPAGWNQPVREDDDREPLKEAWLSAWEATYRTRVVDAISEESASLTDRDHDDRPDAQLVFCIDTRSEIIRRQIEQVGGYETHGYAGFFGVPMRYQGYDSEVTVDACPPILAADHRIEQQIEDDHTRARHDRWSSLTDAGTDLLKALRSNAATAFSFVEHAGSAYGAALTARTLLPARIYDLLDTVDQQVPDEHEFCTPDLDHDQTADGNLPDGLSLSEKVEYAATAFELMGWEEFARVVVFAGHASQTANNPFDSSLDCGACAGNPGGPNARVLATICNEREVRERLRDRGIEIPSDTIFLAGEHNTTTDEITLYTRGVPESHESDIEQLQNDLETARRRATAERVESMGESTTESVRETERRAVDWAETRPEWGLAGNAGFVIGPRALTEGLDLDGRSFLHSYDWRTDKTGEALEAIMTGPMVVTQWINTQYYFATVDTAVYGSGSKITHNPVGNIGVYQGNGGDLMTGLPLQSVMAQDDEPYHQPLRLSTVIHAPVERVTEILDRNESLQRLLDNDWLSLTVVDPEQDHEPFHYDETLTWQRASETEPTTTEPSSEASPVASDD